MTEFLGTKQGAVCMFTAAGSHQVRDCPVVKPKTLDQQLMAVK
jgi:hypothetical protein